MPVSRLNRATRSRSRLWLDPTAASPTKVIFWPPYFFLIAAAFATFGGATAVAFCTRVGLRLLLAAAMLREATSAITPTIPARTSSLRCFTLPRPFCRPLGLDFLVASSRRSAAGHPSHHGVQAT